MIRQRVLILGNKPYYNVKLNNIIDSFDVIYRFNFCHLGKNNGTKFGKLAMCGHVYYNCVRNPRNKQQMIDIYKSDCTTKYISDWYYFFQENKENFDEIYHEDEWKSDNWNGVLEKYGCPHRFSKMASTGYSVIFRSLADSNNEVYVLGFTLCSDEIRKTIGEKDEVVKAKNQGRGHNSYGWHSFSEESRILAWLHNNKKVDASLCMLEDTDELSLKTNEYNTEPSEFILDLLNKG